VSGATVWFTGLSGSGKSTVAGRLARLLESRGEPVLLLDGDDLREGLNADLGFSAEDRAENVRRVGEVARLFARAGHVTLVTVISPYAAGRAAARAAHERSAIPFIEVHVATSLEVCEARDPKGLYKKARAGQLKGFTGIDDPYEPPVKPELVLNAAQKSAEILANEVLAYLKAAGKIADG